MNVIAINIRINAFIILENIAQKILNAPASLLDSKKNFVIAEIKTDPKAFSMAIIIHKNIVRPSNDLGKRNSPQNLLKRLSLSMYENNCIIIFARKIKIF